MEQLTMKHAFICSDPHFGHSKIEAVEPSRGLWRDTHSNHEDFLVDRWNSVVTNEDTIICLGDFSWDAPSKYIGRLNGNKVLIKGNHDTRGEKSYEGMHVINGIFIIMGGVISHICTDNKMVSAFIWVTKTHILVFSHYSLFYQHPYDAQRHNAEEISRSKKEIEDVLVSMNINTLPIINIHGHLHSSKVPDIIDNVKHINVSMENINFTPVLINSLLEEV